MMMMMMLMLEVIVVVVVLVGMVIVAVLYWWCRSFRRISGRSCSSRIRKRSITDASSGSMLYHTKILSCIYSINWNLHSFSFPHACLCRYMSLRESENAASAGGQVAALTGIMDQFAPETLFSIAPVRINACVRVIFEIN